MNPAVTPKMAFQSVMEEFAKAQIPEIQDRVESGTYELPMNGYVLRLIFPTDKEKPGIPFTILERSRKVSCGLINLAQTLPVFIESYPGESEIFQVIDIISRRIGPVPMDEKPGYYIPVLLNGKEISDEWIEWYRKQKPGTSYAEAVIQALIKVREELKRMEAVLDKYKLPS